MPMLDLHVPSYVLPLFAAITTERSRTTLNRIVLVAERRCIYTVKRKTMYGMDC